MTQSLRRQCIDSGKFDANFVNDFWNNRNNIPAGRREWTVGRVKEALSHFEQSAVNEIKTKPTYGNSSLDRAFPVESGDDSMGFSIPELLDCGKAKLTPSYNRNERIYYYTYEVGGIVVTLDQNDIKDINQEIKSFIKNSGTFGLNNFSTADMRKEFGTAALSICRARALKKVFMERLKTATAASLGQFVEGDASAVRAVPGQISNERAALVAEIVADDDDTVMKNACNDAALSTTREICVRELKTLVDREQANTESGIPENKKERKFWVELYSLSLPTNAVASMREPATEQTLTLNLEAVHNRHIDIEERINSLVYIQEQAKLAAATHKKEAFDDGHYPPNIRDYLQFIAIHNNRVNTTIGLQNDNIEAGLASLQDKKDANAEPLPSLDELLKAKEGLMVKGPNEFWV